MIGQANDDGLAMTESGQKKSVETFRSGEFNLMVATDIAQEGLDVPECNYVIRYEFVSNEIGTVNIIYIQISLLGEDQFGYFVLYRCKAVAEHA